MTQEEKQLLLIDLCARLPYGVIVKYKSREKEGNVKITSGNIGYVAELGNGWWKECKPYLRPMSSITEEERTEYEDMCDSFRGEEFHELIDWLNKKMLDYRGLIPMSLALEAPEGMYNIK